MGRGNHVVEVARDAMPTNLVRPFVGPPINRLIRPEVVDILRALKSIGDGPALNAGCLLYTSDAADE